jgi:3-oxoacyl-[acyl-carrier-protein] synthase II
VCAHGTGTVYNDAMELTAFHDIFEQAIPCMFSLKGTLGHTLGPCGLIETIVGMRCLDEQCIPGTVGLRHIEDGYADCLSNACRSIQGDYLLTTNSGFGGVNAALVIERTLAI